MQGGVLWDHSRWVSQPDLGSQGRLPGRGNKDPENEERAWLEQVREERRL